MNSKFDIGKLPLKAITDAAKRQLSAAEVMKYMQLATRSDITTSKDDIPEFVTEIRKYIEKGKQQASVVSGKPKYGVVNVTITLSSWFVFIGLFLYSTILHVGDLSLISGMVFFLLVTIISGIVGSSS